MKTSAAGTICPAELLARQLLASQEDLPAPANPDIGPVRFGMQRWHTKEDDVPQWRRDVSRQLTLDLPGRIIPVPPQAIHSSASGSAVHKVIDLRHVCIGTQSNQGVTSHTREAKIIDLGGPRFRVKNIRYGNQRAAEEVAMAKFYALTGLDCPNSAIAMHGDHLFGFNRDTRCDYPLHRTQPEHFALVASPLIPGFSDLGQCLLNSAAMLPVITQQWGAAGAANYAASLTAHAKAVAWESTLNSRQPIDLDENHPITISKQKARGAQLSALCNIYQQLPDRLRSETMKAYCASRLIGNWDFVNYAWYNVGLHDVTKRPEEWRMATVDFGNSGTMGFGGLQKPDSRHSANERARLTDPKKPCPIRVEDRQFNSDVSGSRTGIGSVPRSRPIVPLIQSLIEAETRIAACSSDASRIPTHEIGAMSAALEVAFRLTLIPDAAFHFVAATNWPDGSMPFPRTDADSLHLSAHDLAVIMIQRRDALVKQFAPREIAEWRRKNTANSIEALQEVSVAVATVTDIEIADHLPGREKKPIYAAATESTFRQVTRRASF